MKQAKAKAVAVGTVGAVGAAGRASAGGRDKRPRDKRPICSDSSDSSDSDRDRDCAGRRTTGGGVSGVSQTAAAPKKKPKFDSRSVSPAPAKKAVGAATKGMAMAATKGMAMAATKVATKGTAMAATKAAKGTATKAAKAAKAAKDPVVRMKARLDENEAHVKYFDRIELHLRDSKKLDACVRTELLRISKECDHCHEAVAMQFSAPLDASRMMVSTMTHHMQCAYVDAHADDLSDAHILGMPDNPRVKALHEELFAPGTRPPALTGGKFNTAYIVSAPIGAPATATAPAPAPATAPTKAAAAAPAPTKAKTSGCNGLSFKLFKTLAVHMTGARSMEELALQMEYSRRLLEALSGKAVKVTSYKVDLINTDVDLFTEPGNASAIDLQRFSELADEDRVELVVQAGISDKAVRYDTEKNKHPGVCMRLVMNEEMRPQIIVYSSGKVLVMGASFYAIERAYLAVARFYAKHKDAFLCLS
jgi:TATA-box binding protein (TBP) (component of TFIID and TFIIIB)